MAYTTVITIFACGIVLSIIVRVLAPHESGNSFVIPRVAYFVADNQLWSWIVLGASFALGWGIAFGKLVYCYFCLKHSIAKLPQP
jgi:hypothetical protein